MKPRLRIASAPLLGLVVGRVTLHFFAIVAHRS